MAKPDGMVVVRWRDGLLPPSAPVSALWGWGENGQCSRTQPAIADIAIRHRTSTALGRRLRRTARAGSRAGRASGGPEAEESPRRRTHFRHRSLRPKAQRRQLLDLSRRSLTLRHRGCGAARCRSSAVLRLHTVTRAHALPSATDVARRSTTAVALLEEMGTTAPVRLLGVRVEGLSGATDAEQLTLDDVRPTSRWRDAEVAVDSARSKFGAAAVRPASLLARNAD